MNDNSSCTKMCTQDTQITMSSVKLSEPEFLADRGNTSLIPKQDTTETSGECYIKTATQKNLYFMFAFQHCKNCAQPETGRKVIRRNSLELLELGNMHNELGQQSSIIH